MDANLGRKAIIVRYRGEIISLDLHSMYCTEWGSLGANSLPLLFFLFSLRLSQHPHKALYVLVKMRLQLHYSKIRLRCL